MTLRPVRLYGDPVLRQKAVPVTRFDAALQALVDDLYETMDAYNGVGLAANQIGVLDRVCVVDVPLDDDRRMRLAMVNPVIVRRAGSDSAEEGCLSIPEVYENVPRSLSITVEAFDPAGKPFRLEAEGYFARAVQHELDHLDGVLFVDRLSPLRRQFLRRPLEALARGELPEGYAPPVQPGESR